MPHTGRKLRSPTNSRIATAASRISRSSWSSSRIWRPRVGEDLVAEGLVDGQVDRTAEVHGWFVLKVEGPEAEAGALRQLAGSSIALDPVAVRVHLIRLHPPN